ncbi:hypothetical protein ASPACDRAFT_61816 [Aspergillus aculeatus ATCC 16872]|uniref:Uncharacterized protein n=1 Tax=Aspergillus aculeatus (strain ATCC 16872 / CBS 172.66 / WB 5094) TaxID=690307 RepID=A0A1L9WQ57_ASPA1|nr:uncharacterized protein ASPACDRAFT_61816 [Aspergillus aculeatus ATCC 16872]OJJ98291.1 hypothetical protein ASPACDRAFT_61816 [Aspergillus aculeatus ATCC 16872]
MAGRIREYGFGRRLTQRREFWIIHALVNNPDKTAAEAIQELLQERNSQFQQGRNSHRPYVRNRLNQQHAFHTMQSLCELAYLLPPDEQTKLLDLVVRLQRTTVHDSAGRDGIVRVAFADRMWTDLPCLREYINHRYTFAPLDVFKGFPTCRCTGMENRTPCGDHCRDYPPQEVQEWENRNCFIAQLTNASPRLGHRMDFSRLGLRLCARACENADVNALEEEAVRAACFWFALAGKRMWDTCVAGDQVDEPEAEEPKAFNRARWSGWKNTINSFGVHLVRRSTQALIKDALASMGQAERGQ